jgi:flagellar biosynthesis protein FliQ
MSESLVLGVVRQAIETAIIISLPMLLVGSLVKSFM